MRRCAIALLLVGCAASPPPAQAPAPGTAGVRPGDVVSIKVWREQDYSGDFTVDSRSIVTVPLLGQISVRGRQAEWLSDSLRNAYQQFLKNPSIEITVLRRIAVSGEVTKPGLYPADATISIGDLIALAGGITPNANRDRVELLRNGQIIVSGLGPGTVLQNSPVQSGDQIFVPQRGWFSRNGGAFLYGGISIASAIIVALIVRK